MSWEQDFQHLWTQSLSYKYLLGPGTAPGWMQGWKGASSGHPKHSAPLDCLKNNLFFPGLTHIVKGREYLHPLHPSRFLQMARSHRERQHPSSRAIALVSKAAGTSQELNAISNAVSSPGASVSVTCCSDALTCPGFSVKHKLEPRLVPALVLNATVVTRIRRQNAIGRISVWTTFLLSFTWDPALGEK